MDPPARRDQAHPGDVGRLGPARPIIGALLILAVLAPGPRVTAGERPVADPMDAFVNGYDPSGGDFFIHEPERTVLLRLRADFNNDGIADLAVSEGSIWGQAGGPWLIFLGDRRGTYTYVGALFFYPAALVIRPAERGTAEVTAFVRDSAVSGHVVVSRVSVAGITGVRDRALQDIDGADRDAYRAVFGGTAIQAESCRLTEYRRDTVHCWRVGVRLE
jgi:hypothetical protein